MAEDFVEAPIPAVPLALGLASAREAAVAELAVDPAVTRAVEAVARRQSGGMLCADEFRQELWIRIIDRVRSGWNPAKAPARAWVLLYVDRWAVSVWRSLIGAAKRAPMPVGVLPEVETNETDPDYAARLAKIDVALLRDGLSAADREHFDLRMDTGVFHGSHQAVADALGVSRRQEGRRWSALLRTLHARARTVPGIQGGAR